MVNLVEDHERCLGQSITPALAGERRDAGDGDRR
jgi:hypothetical protein